MIIDLALFPYLGAINEKICDETHSSKVQVGLTALSLFETEIGRLKDALDANAFAEFERQFTRLRTHLRESPAKWSSEELAQFQTETRRFKTLSNVFGISRMDCDLHSVVTCEAANAINGALSALKTQDIDQVLFELVNSLLGAIAVLCERQELEDRPIVEQFLADNFS